MQSVIKIKYNSTNKLTNKFGKDPFSAHLQHILSATIHLFEWKKFTRLNKIWTFSVKILSYTLHSPSHYYWLNFGLRNKLHTIVCSFLLSQLVVVSLLIHQREKNFFNEFFVHQWICLTINEVKKNFLVRVMNGGSVPNKIFAWQHLQQPNENYILFLFSVQWDIVYKITLTAVLIRAYF